MDIIDFYNAVSSGNLDEVKRFSEEHNGKMPLNKNVTYAYGATYILPLPLIVAFKNERWDVAKYLLKHQANLDVICEKHHKSPREFMPDNFKF